MDKVIPAELRDNVFVYLDDLLVCSPTFEAHMDMLSQVSACFQRTELTINVDKSKFCYSQARYLGYVVGGGCIRTDDAKIQSIQETNAEVVGNDWLVQEVHPKLRPDSGTSS